MVEILEVVVVGVVVLNVVVSFAVEWLITPLDVVLFGFRSVKKVETIVFFERVQFLYHGPSDQSQTKYMVNWTFFAIAMNDQIRPLILR